MLRAIILFVVLTLSLSLISCQEQQISADQVQASLDDLEQKLNWLNYRTSSEMWDWYTTGDSDSLEFYQGLYNHAVSDQPTFRLLQNGKRLITGELDKRRYDLIFGSLLIGQVETDPFLAGLRDSLTNIDLNHRAKFEGSTITTGELYNIYRSEPDRVRRESAYRAWCSVGLEIGDGLERLIRLRNQRARKSGYNSFLAMMFSGGEIRSEDYLKLLRRLDSLSQPAYDAILADIRIRLGYDEVEVWDLAFAYSNVRSRVDRHFPVDSQMAFINSSLAPIGFDLDALPIYFDLESRKGKSQFAYAFRIRPPFDQRVLANLTDGLYSTRVLLHEIGHALHAAHVQQERDLFILTPDGVWDEAMAQMFAALVDQPDWLSKYAHMPANLIEQHMEAVQAQRIIYLRTTLARLHFEYEAYANPNRDLNSVYWSLIERYLDLPSHEDIKPWAAIIHYTTHPGYLMNYIYGDMIAAQTLDFIDRNYDSMVDNPVVGSFLIQNYLRSGSRYPWPELLKRGTDEELNPDYLAGRLGLIVSNRE